ncbi:MAG: SDR family oxidoreductase [Phycisphaerales bacterium]|nr:MAG: SDR family oxidoreductase [Phycisphaerales bacterium]
MEIFSLANERAIVTGGGSGLGEAMARCLISAGARVVVSGRREDVLREAAARLGERASYVVHDVTDESQVDRLVATAAQKNEGPATILINNAGVHLKKPAIDETSEEWRRLLNVHVLGAMALTRAVASEMLQQGRGSILFVTSMAALFGVPEVAAYSAAKSAILGLVRGLALEWSGRGVRVNAIAPGWIDTAMSRRALESDPDRKDRILMRTPMQKLGEPEDVGWAAVYVCSPQAKFVTGQQLVVDGGASIGF